MKAEEREPKPAAVPKQATQAGDIRARWAWVEPLIWTDRMLTALESGVKGGKWFSLMDKVYAPRALEAAFARVKANKGAAGVDHQTVAMFGRKAEENLERLSVELRSGKYEPLPVRRVWIPKPGTRKNGLWGYQRCGTEWRKRHCARRWNPSSSGTSRSTVTGFARVVGARTRCGGWTAC